MPNLFTTFRHLFPRALAWLMPWSGFIRKYVDGLSETPADIRDFTDNVFLDMFPQTTRELERWEKQFNLASTGTDQERKDAIAAAWLGQGGQGKNYLEEVIHAAGFTDAFLHEWWTDTGGGGYTTKNPNLYLTSSAYPAQFGQQSAQFGGGSQFSVPYTTIGGSLLVNKGPNITYIPPTDALYYPEMLYVGAETFPNFVAIPLDRKDEFERLLLKYNPYQFWLGLLVNYVLPGVLWTAVVDSKFGPTTIVNVTFGAEANTFLAGGDAGKMSYSNDDGVTWNIVADSKFGTTTIFRSAFNGALIRFLAVGSSGKMAYSDDACETWTAVIDPTFGTSPILSVDFNDNANKFVAGGFFGKMAYSSNGEIWTAVVDSKFGNHAVLTVAFNVSGNRVLAGGLFAKIRYSDDDGVTWNIVADSKFGTLDIRAIIDTGVNIIAAGEAGTMSYSNDNGITWNIVADSKFGTDYIFGLAYYADIGRVLAVGAAGKMRYSDDNGITWNIVADSKFGSSDVMDIVFADPLEKFLAVGVNGKISYS